MPLWFSKAALPLSSIPDCLYMSAPMGDPGMATAGSGDVLTGLIAALLAQRFKLHRDAACLGVYLHGVAGDLAANDLTSYCMVASDLLDFFLKLFPFRRQILKLSQPLLNYSQQFSHAGDVTTTCTKNAFLLVFALYFLPIFSWILWTYLQMPYELSLAVFRWMCVIVRRFCSPIGLFKVCFAEARSLSACAGISS